MSLALVARARSIGLLRLCAAGAALVVARAWLWLAPGRAVRWASTRSYASSSHTWHFFPGITLDSIVRAVPAIAVRPPLCASCLEQGLALVMLLAATRLPGRLVVGVNRDRSLASSLSAHAWVESNGRVLLGGAQTPGFHPLPHASSSPCRG